MIGCSSKRKAAWCPSRSRMAAPRSACAGSSAASTRESPRTAIRSPPRRCNARRGLKQPDSAKRVPRGRRNGACCARVGSTFCLETAMFTAVHDWSEAMLTALAGGLAMFFAAIPKVIAFAVILAVGWLVAGLIAKLAARLLRAVRFNDLAERSGFGGFVRNIGVKQDCAGFLAMVANWFMKLIVLVVAFDALGLPAVSDVLRQLLLWLPNLVVGIVVLVIGGLLANAAAGLLRG